MYECVKTNTDAFHHYNTSNNNNNSNSTIKIVHIDKLEWFCFRFACFLCCRLFRLLRSFYCNTHIYQHENCVNPCKCKWNMFKNVCSMFCPYNACSVLFFSLFIWFRFFFLFSYRFFLSYVYITYIYHMWGYFRVFDLCNDTNNEFIYLLGMNNQRMNNNSCEKQQQQCLIIRLSKIADTNHK